MKPQQFGRYKVVGSLGMGAMGCVYEGFDPHIERRVAIKTIRLDQLTPDMEAEFEARFRSEVRAAGRLHHPNIVALHDAGRDEGVAYTVMEFVEGQDLKRRLDGGAVYSIDGAIRLVQQLLSALAAAHAQGVIHRDVKPANVMLTASGQVKLTDFGVARVLDSGDATRTRGMIVGTVKYASPEQLSGLPLDGRSDLFSVGVLLYRLLARRHPFDGPNELAIMQKVLTENPPPPSTLNAAVPAGLDAVVLKALAKTPDARQTSAAEFSGELQLFLSGTPYPEPATQPGTQPGMSTAASWTATQALPSDETVRVATVPPRVEAKPSRRTALVVSLAGVVVVAVAAGFALMPRERTGPVALPQPASAPQSSLATVSAPGAPASTASVVQAAAPAAPVIVPPVAASAVVPSIVSAAASIAAPSVVQMPKKTVAALPLLDGRWAGHYLCSEILGPTTSPNRGPFKADIVMQVSGRNITWTRRNASMQETMSGQIAADGRWSAEGLGENVKRKERWLTTGSGIFNRKVSPPRFDGDLTILSPDKSRLFRKCTLTAVREPS